MRTTAWALRFAGTMTKEGMRERRRHFASQKEAFLRGRQVERFEQADRARRKHATAAEVESYFTRGNAA